MQDATYYLDRCLNSVKAQSFTDYEVVISDDSNDDLLETHIRRWDLPIRYLKNPGPKSMADNANSAIGSARGGLVKILFQDDFFSSKHSLNDIADHFTDRTMWLATGCTHSMDGVTTFNDHRPYYMESENTIGSPSVITFRNGLPQRFDPNFHWVLDLDFYKQLYRAYGKPKIWDPPNVVIGIHPGQKTNLLTDERKAMEHQMLKIKYENSEGTKR